MTKDKIHAKMINEYIKFEKNIAISLKFKSPIFYIEKPYNYFGTRGYIDLIEINYDFPDFIKEFMIRTNKEVIFDYSLIEFKNKIEDIGEMFRQCNNAITYFEEDNKEFKQFKSKFFRLIINFTPENMRLIKDNLELFNSFLNQKSEYRIALHLLNIKNMKQIIFWDSTINNFNNWGDFNKRLA